MPLISNDLFHSLAAQNGSGGGQGVDTAVCQQGAALPYSQEGSAFAGLSSIAFKAQTDARVAALPSAGTALMGAYTAGTVTGWYIC